MTAVVWVSAMFGVSYSYVFGEEWVGAEGVSLLPVPSAPVFLCGILVYGVGYPFGMSLLLVILDAERYQFFAFMRGGVAIEEVVGIKVGHL